MTRGEGVRNPANRQIPLVFQTIRLKIGSVVGWNRCGEADKLAFRDTHRTLEGPERTRGWSGVSVETNCPAWLEGEPPARTVASD